MKGLLKGMTMAKKIALWSLLCGTALSWLGPHAWASSVDEGLLLYVAAEGAADAVVVAGSASPTQHQATRFVGGRFGQGIELVGDAQLSYSGEDQINLQDGTVAFWANRHQPWSQRKACPLFKAVAGPGWNRNALHFVITRWNQFRVWIFDDESRQTLYMTRPLPSSTNAWYHLAFTYTDGEVRIFIDGEEGSYTSDGEGDPMMLMPEAEVQMIQFGSDGDQAFEGVYDEMRIYDRVLSPEEIQALVQYVPAE